MIVPALPVVIRAGSSPPQSVAPATDDSYEEDL